MKKFLFLLLSVSFVFSCKVSVQDTISSHIENLRDNSSESVGVDDDYLTEYATNKGALMFVSDEHFALKVNALYYFTPPADYKYLGRNWGEFYYLNSSNNENWNYDEADWENLYDHFEIKEYFGKGTEVSQPNKFIPSKYDETLGKWVAFLKGTGENDSFKLRFSAQTGASQIGCYGNMLDLLRSDDANKEEFELGKSAFYKVFSGFSQLNHAPYLPSKNLSEGCYSYMFEGCDNLTEAPALPATELTDGCYEGMFMDCSSLKAAPALPATVLTVNCYKEMFRRCSNLEEAPALPATELADSCYAYMFASSSIKEAPALPATELADSCYAYMFFGSSSIEEAPALPATELADNCYNSMFMSCENLKKAPDLPALVMKPGCYQYMFSDCKSLETSSNILPATELADSCYFAMFMSCENLKNAPALPALVMKPGCYEMMFAYTGIESVPALPAANLAEHCYRSMFAYCRNIGDVDEDLLSNATVLPKGCYEGMFVSSGIKTPLKINATEVGKYCMDSMFAECKNLAYILFPNISSYYTDDESDICVTDSMFLEVAGVAELAKPEYTDFALNHIDGYKLNSNMSNAQLQTIFGFWGNVDTSNYSDYYFDKEVKGLSFHVSTPYADDTTHFKSQSEFSIISPSGKTWDGTLYYYSGSAYKEWDGSKIDAVQDVRSGEYFIYLVGDNTFISNGKSWKIEGSDVILDLKLGGLLAKSGRFIWNAGKKYREISVGDNCFNSWFKGNSALKGVIIQNDPCSVISAGAKSFYSAFENSQSLAWIDVNLNNNTKDSDYLAERLVDLAASRSLESTYSHMFLNCPKLSADAEDNFKVLAQNLLNTTFADVFELTPQEEKESTSTDVSKETTKETKTATGSTKILNPASTSPKDHAKSGVKKPFKSQSAQEGVIRIRL